MKIMKADFMLSAAAAHQFPDTELPEVCFAGRSNVGKSSMINKLVERKSLVKVGNKPGKTRLVNFFNINDHFILTDLPGYGYAVVSKSERAAWGKLMNTYFAKREQLSLCVLLLDFRRVPNDDDMGMLYAMRSSGIPVMAVLTKTDKLSKNEQAKQVKIIAEKIGIPAEELIRFSSHTGQGRQELWEKINQVCLQS